MVSGADGGVIRIASPDIRDEDLDAVVRVLRSGQLVQGPHVAEFEGRLAGMIGTSHVIAVSNCTAALHVALMALGVGPGDEVAVPTYSWPATANAITLTGAAPVFVDIDPETFNMDPEALLRAISGRRLKAVIAVHAFGSMADMRRIVEIAQSTTVPVVEDAACALGASLDGKTAGSWGTAGCFSFHPRKAVTTGEGGGISTDDSHFAQCVRALRNHGQDSDAPAPDFIMPGYNLRMTEFQAVLGSGQLNRWSDILAARRQAAERYDRLLASVPVRIPHALEPLSHTYQSYVVLLPKQAARARSSLIAHMRENGVEVAIGTYHIPLTTYYRQRFGFRVGQFPATDDVASRALALPLHTKLSFEDQERVVNELAACL
jgi:perosamine synthetase